MKDSKPNQCCPQCGLNINLIPAMVEKIKGYEAAMREVAAYLERDWTRYHFPDEQKAQDGVMAKILRARLEGKK